MLVVMHLLLQLLPHLCSILHRLQVVLHLLLIFYAEAGMLSLQGV